MNISVLVGLKNNLKFTKEFYKHFREVYPEEELVFVSYGSVDGTNEWLDSLEDSNIRYYYSETSKTFSDTYNKCVDIATKEYVVMMHNDILVAPLFLEEILKELSKSKVVSYTTVEPPIFMDHSRPGKIIRNFGSDFWDMNKEAFFKFVKEKQRPAENTLAPGISFFMALSKELFQSIGGFDNIFSPMFCEDSDIISRFSNKGVEMLTTSTALCYHFVSKTSRFSDEYRNSTKVIELNSITNFIRKWGYSPDPTVAYHYNVGLSIKNAPEGLIAKLEPYFSTLQVDVDMSSYIEESQGSTAFNLRSKFISFEEELQTDIIVEVDEDLEDYNSLRILSRIPFFLHKVATLTDDLEEQNLPATYKVDHEIKVHITRFKDRSDELLTLDSIYYKSKLL